jgi:hypothetical protein
MDHEQTARTKARFHAQRTGRTRALIVGGVFVALLGTGLLIGQRLLSDPAPPGVRIAAPETFRSGRILYALPAGKGCKHFAFDNATGELGEIGTGPCEYPDPTTTGGVRQAGKSQPGAFAWGNR